MKERLPLIIFLRNRHHDALTAEEVKTSACSRFIKMDGALIDGKVPTNITYPASFMDVISIDKRGENFGLIYDTNSCLAAHCITSGKAKYKLYIVRKIFVGTKESLVCHDAHTIHYTDTLHEDWQNTDFIKFDTGNLCMVTGGANLGRTGMITNPRETPWVFWYSSCERCQCNSFATQLSNIFVISKGKKTTTNKQTWKPFLMGR
ncbi:LOW QUALITY PROTEIN: hypothetical protein QTO34_006590, partial [Cnephaeus nilssonii]